MTRITMLHVDLPPEAGGGVAAQVGSLSEVLQQRGHDVTVRTLSVRPPGVSYRVDTVRFPTAAHNPLGHLIGVPIAFASGAYRTADTIHAHGDSQLLFRRHTPVVRTFYGSALEEARHAKRMLRRFSQYSLIPAERIARHLAAVTVGISNNTSASIGELDAIIPCGVHTSHFRPSDKSDYPSILFVGTVGGRKRGQLLLDAFQQSILPRVPTSELWIVSKDRAEGRQVRWFGRVGDRELRRLFARAWVFCLPSSYEGFGVPYIEAMASGTAVVATRNVGADEVIVPGSGGVVVADQDLGPAVSSLLLDKRRRTTLEKQGPIYSRRFDWARVAQAYEEMYALAAHRRQGRSL